MTLLYTGKSSGLSFRPLLFFVRIVKVNLHIHIGIIVD